jgi:hypothetical protein
MLWVLISVEELSCEPTVWDDFDSLDPVVSTVEADDSRRVACDAEAEGVGSSSSSSSSSSTGMGRSGDWADVSSSLGRDDCVGVEGVGGIGRVVGVRVGMEISSGSRSFVAVMVVTIFSRSTGVMCFSRPRLVLLSMEDGLRRGSGRGLAMRGVIGMVKPSSSESAESRLEERAGR